MNFWPWFVTKVRRLYFNPLWLINRRIRENGRVAISVVFFPPRFRKNQPSPIFQFRDRHGCGLFHSIRWAYTLWQFSRRLGPKSGGSCDFLFCEKVSFFVFYTRPLVLRDVFANNGQSFFVSFILDVSVFTARSQWYSHFSSISNGTKIILYFGEQFRIISHCNSDLSCFPSLFPFPFLWHLVSLNEERRYPENGKARWLLFFSISSFVDLKGIPPLYVKKPLWPQKGDGKDEIFFLPYDNATLVPPS